MKTIVVESINIGLPKAEIFQGKETTTGICKKPVQGPLHLKKTGFEGDAVADLKNHGGEDKAVCVYSKDHYPYWEKTLGMKLPPAAFGENLSVSNLREGEINIGDIFQLGTAVTQVSQPRQPCKTLSARYGRSDLVKLVIYSGYTGFYLRVLKEGITEKQDRLILMERNSHNISISFANHIFHQDKKNRDGIEKVLAVPALSESWERSFQKLRDRVR